MKKFLSALIALCIVFMFVGCKSEKISQTSEASIQNRILYNKISNSVNMEYLNATLSKEEAQEWFEKSALPETKEEVIKELDRDLRICQLAEENKVLIGVEKVRKTAKDEFDNLKTDNGQNEYYNVLKKCLSEYEMTEDEYIDVLLEKAYYQYNEIALQEFFSKNGYDKQSDKTFAVQFEEYIKRS